MMNPPRERRQLDQRQRLSAGHIVALQCHLSQADHAGAYTQGGGGARGVFPNGWLHDSPQLTIL